MIKKPAVFIISLVVLILITSCTPDRRKPAKAEPPKIEPAKIESPESKPAKAEPVVTVEPLKTEPVKIEPPKIEPEKTKPKETKPPPKPSFRDKFADILKNFVDDNGMVKYKELKRKKIELKKVTDELAKLDPNKYSSWTKEDKIAFWINAYNIQRLKIIADNYPIKSTRWHRIRWHPESIRHIEDILRGRKFIIMQEEFTLPLIKRQFFQQRFKEPRAFFALSLTSLSSPPLRREPYYGQRLYEQLDDQIKKFLSSPQAFAIDRERQRVYLAAIFDPSWYGKSFIHQYAIDKKFKAHDPATRAVLNFITNYISKKDISFLEVGNYSVKYIKYDWRLNDGS